MSYIFNPIHGKFDYFHNPMIAPATNTSVGGAFKYEGGYAYCYDGREWLNMVTPSTGNPFEFQYNGGSGDFEGASGFLWKSGNQNIAFEKDGNGTTFSFYLGLANDAAIYYDGTDLIIDSDRVGSGACVINGLAIRAGGDIKPAQWADGSAPNDSIYYSTTQGKLVYKDATGTVNNLY